jgi:hypothetical protein
MGAAVFSQMWRSVLFAGLVGAALAAAPSAEALALKGPIQLNLAGGTVHGYHASLGGEVTSGAPSPTAPDDLALVLTKTKRGLVQTYSWTVAPVASDVTVNPSKASITVRDPLGTGGADGAFNFTISGRPHVKTSSCGTKYTSAAGTLTGTIRVNTGHRFFKTITVKHMTGTAADLYTCLARCPRPYYFVNASGVYSPTKPFVGVEAATAGGKGYRPSVDVFVFDPTRGTPFTSISNELYATGDFYSSSRNLTRVHVSTPGGALSGGLSLTGSGSAHTTSYGKCVGGIPRETNRSASVTSGRITAKFDSIGTVVLGANLNAGLRSARTISRVS